MIPYPICARQVYFGKFFVFHVISGDFLLFSRAESGNLLASRFFLWYD